MAFIAEDTGNGGGNFIRILDGSLVRKSETAKEGYEEFNTENPSTKEPVKYWIKRANGGVQGLVTSLERVEIEASKVFGWNLHMEDEEGKFSIFFNDDRTTTSRLLKTFENIDLSQEVLIKVFRDKEGHPGISFTQNGAKVEQKWVGGIEGNLPQPKKTKGKWDYSGVEEFLYNNAVNNILPKFATEETTNEAAKAATVGASPDDMDY